MRAGIKGLELTTRLAVEAHRHVLRVVVHVRHLEGFQTLVHVGDHGGGVGTLETQYNTYIHTWITKKSTCHVCTYVVSVTSCILFFLSTVSSVGTQCDAMMGQKCISGF